MKKTLKIYFSEDSEIVELETAQKEWRGDIIIAINNNFYMLEFITLNRLIHEYKNASNDSNPYFINSVTVIVEKPDKKTIIKSILQLNDKNFFNSCKTINLRDYYSKTFIELADIKNWTQVY